MNSRRSAGEKSGLSPSAREAWAEASRMHSEVAMAKRMEFGSVVGRPERCIDQRDPVFLEDRLDLGRLGFDQPLDLLLPFAFAVAHAHGHLVVEPDAFF